MKANKRRVARANSKNIECPVCGNPGGVGIRCEKCGELLSSHPSRYVLVVDVAHSGESWDEAQEKIIKAVDRALIGRHKGVKIVHGYGHAIGQGIIRTRAIDLLNVLARRTGGRLKADGNNLGAHILWLAD